MEQPVQRPICPELEGAQAKLNADYGHTPVSDEQWQRFNRQIRCLGGTVCSGPIGIFKKRCGNEFAAGAEFARRQSPTDLPSDEQA